MRNPLNFKSIQWNHLQAFPISWDYPFNSYQIGPSLRIDIKRPYGYEIKNVIFKINLHIILIYYTYSIMRKSSTGTRNGKKKLLIWFYTDF
jgi:hypothetical protein